MRTLQIADYGGDTLAAEREVGAQERRQCRLEPQAETVVGRQVLEVDVLAVGNHLARVDEQGQIHREPDLGSILRIQQNHVPVPEACVVETAQIAGAAQRRHEVEGHLAARLGVGDDRARAQRDHALVHLVGEILLQFDVEFGKAEDIGVAVVPVGPANCVETPAIGVPLVAPIDLHERIVVEVFDLLHESRKAIGIEVRWRREILAAGTDVGVSKRDAATDVEPGRRLPPHDGANRAHGLGEADAVFYKAVLTQPVEALIGVVLVAEMDVGIDRRAADARHADLEQAEVVAKQADGPRAPQIDAVGRELVGVAHTDAGLAPQDAESLPRAAGESAHRREETVPAGANALQPVSVFEPREAGFHAGALRCREVAALGLALGAPILRGTSALRLLGRIGARRNLEEVNDVERKARRRRRQTEGKTARRALRLREHRLGQGK